MKSAEACKVMKQQYEQPNPKTEMVVASIQDLENNSVLSLMINKIACKKVRDRSVRRIHDF